MPRLALRHKLFLTLFAVIAVFVLAVNQYVLRLLHDLTESRIEDAIASSQEAWQRFDEARWEVLRARAETIAGIAHLKATLEIPRLDRATLDQTLASVHTLVDTPLLRILDPQGNPFGHEPARTDPLRIDAADLSPVLANGELVAAFARLGTRPFRVAMAPVISGDSLVGVVVIGEPVGSPADIEAILDISSADVALIEGNTLRYPAAAAIGSRAAESLVDAILAAARAGVDQSHDASGDLHLAVVPVTDDILLAFHMSHSTLAKRSEAIQRGIWIASLVALVLGALLSQRVAARVTRPLARLTQAAIDFGRGEPLPQTAIHSGDEIGTLANAFWKMAGDIEREQHSLIRAREIAEASSRAKSTFLATMSHEIRTPLNGIVGMADLLQQTGLTRTQAHYCETVKSSSQALLTILNDVLDFSKIEAGQFQIDAHEVQPAAVVDEATRLFVHQASNKGLTLERQNHLPPGLRVHADDIRLRQVLTNLLSNAVKFTDRGSVTLAASVLRSDDHRVLLRFEVMDTGFGMDQATLVRVFDAFTQADGSMSRHYGGTGLGLTISRQIVELMGGKLQAESEPGKGSRFWFDIDCRLIASGHLPDLAAIRVKLAGFSAADAEQLTRLLASWGTAVMPPHESADLLIVGDEAAMDDAMTGRPTVYLTDIERLGTFEPLRPGLHAVTQRPLDPSAFHDTLLHLLTRMDGRPEPARRLPDIPRFEGLTALVAEDNPVNQEVANAALSLMGVQVINAANGAEAVQRFRESRPSFVLMDCQMPEVDGFEATRRIRQQETGGRTPIFALTANAFASDRDDCLSAGMDDFLGKPFTIQELGMLIGRWFPAVTAPSDATALSPAPVEAPGVSPLSRESLDTLRDLTTPEGGNLLDRIIDLYIDSTPANLDRMETAISIGDSAGVRRLAHTLKSSSANLGARSLADRYAAIEAAAAQGDLSGLTIEALRVAHQQLLPWLEAERSRSSAHPPASLTEAHPADRLVLVVDDDPAFRLSMRSALLPHHFDVVEADGGDSAYEASLLRLPDLVLMDALMPGLDGYETCRRFRADPQLADVPILMVTSLDDQDSVDRAFASGASGFIAKPVQYTSLGHHVRFMIRASETTRALREHQLQLVTAQRLASLGYWRWHVHSGEFEVSQHFLGDGHFGNLDSIEALAAVVVDEDRQGFMADIGRALEENITLESSYRIHTGERLIHIHQHLSRDSQARRSAVLVGTIQDVTARRMAEEQVRRLAYYDALTGLASRTFLYERIGEMIRSSRRRGIGFTLLFLDLDGFKDVNDTQGHSAGDALLKIVAERLQGSVRDNDFVARFGGDEFCILLEDLEDEMDIRMIASRCLDHVSEPAAIGPVMVKTRTSIGIARYPYDADDLNGLLRAADSAMYEAKSNGKHRFEYYDAAMTARAEQRFLLAQQLREALVQGQFDMHYQPQISLQSGRVVGFEALARWNHPERGLLPPSEFISELTHLKLINDFEAWAIQHVCAQIARWQSEGIEVPIAVNVSAEHFRRSSLPEIVTAALTSAGVPADRLVLEVTESAMQYTEEAVRVLHQLRDMGIKVAIDDFGTGFSSLASLQNLPVHYIKIDRLFIRDLTDVPKEAIMLGTIVTLAHALGFSIIAEGVENTAQIQILSGLECDTVQGFYFAKPAPAAEVPVLARRVFATSLESRQRRRLAS